MFIVDSHCHVSEVWYEPVESLLFQMDRAGVERAVLVQMTGQPDNGYQFEAVRRFPDRLVSVVWLQADSTQACGELRRLAERGASGVRLSAAVRSPGDDPLAIWRTADELNLTVSSGGGLDVFASNEFARIPESLPNLRIVVEHLGGSGRRHPDPPTGLSEPRRAVFALSRFPNIYIKIAGLGEFCNRLMPAAGFFPFEGPLPPLLPAAYEAFGAARMMWGSDYPPVSAREGYQLALRLTLEQFASHSAEDRALMFGEVAYRLFPPRR
jgi:L-fuconolactonase